MPDSTVPRRAFVLNVGNNHANDQSADDPLLQLAAMLGAVRDTCVSRLAEATREPEDSILESINILYDQYYQNFLEQLNRNN